MKTTPKNEHMFECGCTVSGMSLDVGTKWRPDGPVRYRYDVVTGKRIGIMPATCKRGVHSLAEVGYEATERDGRLVIRCKACAAIPKPDHSWHLTSTAPTPSSAELADGPYVGIDPHFVARPVARTPH